MKYHTQIDKYDIFLYRVPKKIFVEPWKKNITYESNDKNRCLNFNKADSKRILDCSKAISTNLSPYSTLIKL